MPWVKQHLFAMLVPLKLKLSADENLVADRPRWRFVLSVRLVILSLLFVALTAAVITLLRPPSESHLSSTTTFPSSANTNVTAPNIASGVEANSDLLVYVVGSVQRPGLFAVPAGSRVIDVVMAAGGFTVNSELCAINLARTVTDGEQIIVPFLAVGATPCAADESRTSGTARAAEVAPVSLSRASLAELDALPGIGPALAQRIIDYREQHGAFSNIQQLDDVSGIGAKLLANLTPLVVP